MNYTFANGGSYTTFTPDKKTKDANGNAITLLDLHKQLVRDANRHDVYIMDHKGRIVDTSATISKAA